VSRHFFVTVGLMLCLPAALQAQLTPYNQSRRQQPVLQPMEISGTIQGVARGGLVVANTNNQVWRVAILPATKVQVTGTATAESLRPGVLVEFTAEIDSHRAVQGKVDTLTVTSLTREKQMGVFPADADGFGGKSGDDSGKPAKPAKRSGHGEKAPGKAAGKAGHEQAAGSYRIVGRLMVGRGGGLAVQAGRGTLQFQLADDAKINIDMADMSLVSRGNEVSINAMVAPARPGIAQAVEIKVKLPEPKGIERADKKDRAAKLEAKKPAKGAKKGEDKGLPEADANP
jgi:hypothetical protein